MSTRASAPHVLVLGAGGMLGRHLIAELEARSIPFTSHVAERFARPQEIRGHLDLSSPEVVVNCIGYAGTDPVTHYLVNGCLPRTVADWCAGNERQAILISTNAVFPPDEQRPWWPNDPIDPRTEYEVSKAFGEDPRAHVIRTSFIGRDPGGSGIWEALLAGRPYLDRGWNGVTALVLARHIADAILEWRGRRRVGVEHVHAPDVIRFRELAELVGSASRCDGQRNDTRLLAGGLPKPPLRTQIAEYLDARTVSEH